MADKRYYVYILTNWNDRVMYVGMTNDIVRRIGEHKAGVVDSFSKKYKIYKLVYLEVCRDVEMAIAREKQIKGMRREKKNRQ